jgi:hypothetical protein
MQSSFGGQLQSIDKYKNDDNHNKSNKSCTTDYKAQPIVTDMNTVGNSSKLYK